MNKTLPIILFVAICLLKPSSSICQNYIGLHKDEIKSRVSNELSGFSFSNEVFNYDRSFIRFENIFKEQTIVFLLNKDGYCTSVSRMYNTWLFNRIIDDLNERYGESKTHKWKEERDGHTYEIELVRGQWFVTVTTQKK